MSISTQPLCASSRRLQLSLLLLLTWLLVIKAHAWTPLPAKNISTGRTLHEALNIDGTLRPGQYGSFNASGYQLITNAQGQPSFQPLANEDWSDKFGGPLYAFSTIRALAVASNGDILIGGEFTALGGNPDINYVARWNGTKWQGLGTGTNGYVLTLAVASNGDVIAGGNFTVAGSNSNANHIARWDGTTWQAFGTGLNNSVYALAIAGNGNVLAGGQFSSAGGNANANGVARWTGSGWQSLGSGVIGGTVYALAIASNGDVLVGGNFQSAGGNTNASHVARWTGLGWQSLGMDTRNFFFVFAIAFAINGDVLIGGRFVKAGGSIYANNIARWNGTSWQALGTGIGTGDVLTLVVASNGDVIAGGEFSGAGGNTTANRIGRWNGTSWQDMGAQINPVFFATSVRALAIANNNDIILGGNVGDVGGNIKANDLARWNGTSWQALIGKGLSSEVLAVAVAGNGDVIVGGRFTNAEDANGNYIARWDGTHWQSLGAGLNGTVRTLAIAGNGDIIAGGSFTAAAGNSNANNIARWDGTSWQALGLGTNSTVYTLAIASNGDVIAGGGFTSASNTANTAHIARWNGTSWQALGIGLNDFVFAVTTTSNGDIIAGGFFTNAGNIVGVNSIARWDGTDWRRIGSGINDYVAALAIASNGDIIAGTYSQRVVRWNGTNWQALGTNFNGTVYSVAVAGNGDIIAGGGFTAAGGNSNANNIARWDGTSWQALGTGTDRTVYALMVANNGNIVVGGAFLNAGGSTNPSYYFGIYGSNTSNLAQPLLTVYHLTQPGNTTQRTNLNFQTTGTIKVGADNTVATLFSIPFIAGRSLTFRIQENSTNTSTGSLANATGYLSSPVITSATVEAVYHHPSFVEATGSHKDLHLELVDNATNTVLGTYPVQAVRPPLLLVHGLWSNGQDAYPGLPTRLVTDGLYDRESDIHYAHYDNDREFSHNASFIINCKNALLQSYADHNISVSKIDVIGHSMGGLLMRQYIQSGAYQQDVNKLITLNTPHSGSPIPNFINWLTPVARTALTNLLIWQNMNPLRGAVDDLNYSAPSAGIARLNNSPNMRGVAVHAVTTDIVVSPTLPIQQILNGNYSWGGIFAGWAALTYPGAISGVNTFLNQGMFGSRYDLIVGLNSQQGGLVAPYTSNIAGQWHGSGGNPTVQSQFELLLRANSYSTASTNPFTTAGFQPTPVISIFPLLGTPTTSTSRITSTLQITTPTRSTVVTTDSIQVAVSASSDITRIMLVCGTGTTELTTKLINGAGGSTYIRVPKGGLSRLKLAAFSFADSVYVQVDTLSMRLATTATLTSLRLEPHFVYTTVRDSAIVQVIGSYSDGIDRNVVGQPGLLFSFISGGKARMGNRNSYVVGLATGRDLRWSS